MNSQPVIGILLKQMHDSIVKESNNLLQSNDLTMAQIHLLLILSNDKNETCTLKELEKSLHVAQSTTVGLVKRLEQKGFLESYGDKDDKRIKLARITPAGLDVCKQAQENLIAVEQHLMDGLSDAEVGIFTELLKKMLKNFL